MAAKEDVRLIAEHAPERIAEIRELEVRDDGEGQEREGHERIVMRAAERSRGREQGLLLRASSSRHQGKAPRWLCGAVRHSVMRSDQAAASATLRSKPEGSSTSTPWPSAAPTARRNCA